MFICFFEGGHSVLSILSKSVQKNLENGKTLSSFFKYSPNIFSQNFPVRKLVKRKFSPVSQEIKTP